MNNCEIKSPPVFSQEIPKWDRNTYADGNAMGAVVEQLFNNTVYNKEELKEKVDTEGGDISETQVSVLDESTEAFPVPMSGDKAKGLWGKLKKWQQDCLAKFGNYVLTSMITNQHVNSTSNIPSSALVYLMQQGVTQLNRDFTVTQADVRTLNNKIIVNKIQTNESCPNACILYYNNNGTDEAHFRLDIDVNTSYGLLLTKVGLRIFKVENGVSTYMKDIALFN